MPMIPMEPAKEVRKVRPFLVIRLLRLRPKDVARDIDALPRFLWTAGSSLSIERGLVSLMIFPSLRRTVRLAY